MKTLNWNRTEWYARTYGWQIVMSTTCNGRTATIRAICSPNSKKIQTLVVSFDHVAVAEVNATKIGGRAAIAAAKNYVAQNCKNP